MYFAYNETTIAVRLFSKGKSQKWRKYTMSYIKTTNSAQNGSFNVCGTTLALINSVVLFQEENGPGEYACTSLLINGQCWLSTESDSFQPEGAPPHTCYSNEDVQEVYKALEKKLSRGVNIIDWHTLLATARKYNIEG